MLDLANSAPWDVLYVAVGMILFVAVVAIAAAVIPQKEQRGEAPPGSPQVSAPDRRRHEV